MRHDDSFESYCEHIEQKRKEINARAIEQYEKEGTLSDSVLLEESKELDTLLNRALFEERMAQFIKKKDQNTASQEPGGE